MPKVNKITGKMMDFCKEYINNGYDATMAYLTAYDCNSKSAARIEGSKLLQRDDITEYIQTLLKPSENKAISEREKKRRVLWDIIENGDNNDKCRAMDILNKMDQEYININRNIESKPAEVINLSTEALKKLTKEA